jgi:hypothetical protein
MCARHEWRDFNTSWSRLSPNLRFQDSRIAFRRRKKERIKLLGLLSIAP